MSLPINALRVRPRLWLLIVVSSMVMLTACDILGISDSENDNSAQPTDSEPAEVTQPETRQPEVQATPEPEAESQQQVPDEAYQIDRDDGEDGTESPVRVVEGSLQEPRTLNPVLVSDPISEQISGLVFSGLTRVDPDAGEPSPDLAADWSISENGTTYTFHLREGTIWHDGQPVTSQDVVFTFELMMDDRTRSPRYSRVVERVAAVEAVDAHTVEFRLLAPHAPFLNTIATFGIVPQHLLGNVLPDELVADPFGTSSAVGTGPFMLARWERGERLVFDAFPDHHLSTPGFDQYEFRVVTDAAELYDGLESGSIDWASVGPDLFADLNENSTVEARSIPSFEMVNVMLQLDSGTSAVFQNQPVRHALLLALDREGMVDEIWNGHAAVAHGTIPPASWAATEPEIRYDFNPERAGELLDEAGWALGDNGIRQRAGEPLQFTMVANGENPVRRELAEWLVEQWRSIGVDASFTFETWGSIRDRVTTIREFEAMLLGYRWGPDPDQHAMWSSDSIPDAFNLGSYMNSDVDRLLDDALVNSDRETRAQLYAEMQELVLQDLPVLPLAFPNQLIAVGPRLHHEAQTAILLRNRSNVAEWVPEDSGQGDD